MSHRVNPSSPRILLSAVALAVAVLLSGDPALAGGCQNQIAIDTCKLGCTATSAACGALCGAAVDVCTNGCVGGCSVSCVDDCCAGFCSDSRSCRRCIGNCKDDCHDGCQLKCDDCIFDCKQDCESICVPFRELGEPCIPVIDRCDDDLVCWPIPTPGDDTPRCFPKEGDDAFSDEECRGFYSSSRHGSAIDRDQTTTYGRGTALAAGAAFTIERGAVYGRDGRYGCFVTECVGGTIDAEIGTFVSIGLYGPYDSVAGQSVAIVSEAAEGFGGVQATILDTDGTPMGSTFSASVEFSAEPIAYGVYDCATRVNTVGIRRSDGSLAPVVNSPPIARCMDVEECADAASCTASADVDAGSEDPDVESVVLTQAPPPPYPLGQHLVTLTATDPDGAFDTCQAQVTVEDCTGPSIESVSADPAVLWPPNHRMRPVEIRVEATDACGGDVACQLTGVESSEPDARPGRSGRGMDAEVLGPMDLLLRAERRGNGSARIYTAELECTDVAGNASSSDTTVIVPHDQRKLAR